jgi:hypothetical protein
MCVLYEYIVTNVVLRSALKTLQSALRSIARKYEHNQSSPFCGPKSPAANFLTS